MRSYLLCALAIGLFVASGCGGSSRTTPDARDGAGDGNGDGSAGADRADVGTGKGGTGGAAGTGGTGGAAGTGGAVGGAGGTGGTGGAGGTSDAGGNDGGAGSDGGGTDGGGPDAPAPTCNDGIKNSDETDVDCGGHCGKCAPNKVCGTNADCMFSCRANKTCADCNIAADCSGPETECVHRTCTAGVCGSMREAAGTVLAVQTTGDCKRDQCAADGTIATVNDDTDVPDDRNPCTNDICTSGVASHTMMPANSNCGGANHCNATGQCIGCSVPGDCPGNDTACRTRTCTSGGVCGFSLTASGTKLVDPTAGDCKGLQCDGAGNTQVFNDSGDLPVDGNPCTTDECSSGTPSHRPVASGMNCGGSLVCDGASNCVQCLTATTCPGTDTECHTRSCINGQCGVTNAAAGTAVAAQTPHDCKKNVCSGGAPVTVADDTDLPVDNNPCTSDLCNAGTPSNPNLPSGTTCGTSTICDGRGACVSCLTASGCPGTDTECHHRTCTNGQCGVDNTTQGTPLTTQTTGDCKQVQCDGNGGTMSAVDDTDKPVDGKACTGDVCTNGVPTNPNLTAGTACGTSLMCDGNGACVGCITAANCGTDTTCQTHTCTNGTCGVNNAPAGTPLPNQTPGDCKKVQCDGTGQVQTVTDDTDKPVDNNACTQDLCSAGSPSNPPEASGTACNQNGGSKCNGSAANPACVQCLQPSDCSGTDTECHARTCSNAGTCGVSNTADGTPVSGQTAGDCKKNVCMSGNQISVNDNTDVPVDNNGCTMDVCMNGMPSNPSLAANAPCNENGGTRCNGSPTAPNCVQCLNAGQCGANTECQSFACSSGGQCSTSYVQNGTPVSGQYPGDCKKNVCNGSGTIVAAVDNTDLPVDGNGCTDDVCNAGSPSNPPRIANAPCNENGGNRCNGSATTPACVQCLQPTDCGTDTACKAFSCDGSGQCGSSNTADGTVVGNPVIGDCHKNICAGGNITNGVDDSDLPVDGNPCTNDVCSGGLASNPNVQAGTSCGGNLMCDGNGNCVGCITEANCPAAPNACQVRVCTNGTCGFTNVAANTLVTNVPVGDCHKDICDGYGNVTTVVDDNDKPSTGGNQCLQSICSGGVPTTPPFGFGVPCDQNAGTECDGLGACVQCVNANECAGGPDTECHTRTCTNGICGIHLTDANTAVSSQSSGDCQVNVCDGSGNVQSIPDDSDLPIDTNECHNPMCVGGVPMDPNRPSGTACTQSDGVKCDGNGACVQCFDATECSGGPDTECHMRTCTTGLCGIHNTNNGTPLASQTQGDCQQKVCDGNGGTTSITDDTDILPMTNECVTPTCAAGIPGSVNIPHGTSCTQSSGRTCDGAGTCMVSFDVVRVGDGVTAPSNAATATFIEEHLLSTGALVPVGNTIALPTAEAAPNHAFALAGAIATSGAGSEGELQLSLTGKVVVLAGYNRAVGVTGNVTTSSAGGGTPVNRMAASVDGSGVVDTSTLFGTSAFSGNNVRGATSIDGNTFWASGAGGVNAGIWFANKGASTSLQIFGTAIRWLSIFTPPGGASQLYGTGGNSPLTNVFTVGSGIPMAVGQTATTLPGMPTAATPIFSPHGFWLFDRDNNGTMDTLYMADDGAGTNPATDRGIQKWTFSTVNNTWSRTAVTMVDPGANPVGFRGLLAIGTPTDVTLIAVTSDAVGNRIVKFVDTGSGTPTGSVISTAAANTAFRGVALAPHR